MDLQHKSDGSRVIRHSFIHSFLACTTVIIIIIIVIINEKINVAFSPKTAKTRNTHKKDYECIVPNVDIILQGG